MRRLALLLSLPTLLFAAEPSVREMNLTTPDGYTLSGTLTVPATRGRHPAVLLVHPFQSNREGWDPLVAKLNERGLATLALDLRGHGRSLRQGEAEPSITSTYLTAAEAAGFDQIPADLTLAASWLRKQKGIDGRHLGLAGADEGAFAALLASSKLRPTVTLALSPLGAEGFGPGAQHRLVTAATRAHAALMAFVSLGDQEPEDNLAPLRPMYGSNIRGLEGRQRGLAFLETHSDVMAVFFAEYLLHPHTGKGIEKPQEAAAPPSGTVLTPATPGSTN